MTRTRPLRLLAVLGAATVALALDEVGSEPLSAASLASDDECAADGGDDAKECSLSALQLRAKQKQAPMENDAIKANASQAPSSPTVTSKETGEQVDMDCGGNCMMKNLDDGEPPLGAGPIWHWAANCWTACGSKPGRCDSFCGPGNACCRYYAWNDPPECRGVTMWPVMSWHTCVHGYESAPSAPSPSYEPPDHSTHPYYQVGALSKPSDAPLLTFYMYRVQSDSNYPPENVNTASLSGIMWYLHNEVVYLTPRKFGITRIMRIKVSVRAPQPLYDKGMNFGVRYAFDSGMCTGPWNCDDDFARYGFFVGCNNVGEFPTSKWAKDNHYKDAIWYSLPGPCSDKKFTDHNAACIASSPGGACAGEPTGRGDCTYTYENAGEITVDELEGIPDYKVFIAYGGREYDKRTDKGYGTSFWDNFRDDFACAQRVERARKLFVDKYGEDLPTPPCDFNFAGFYSDSTHADALTPTMPAPAPAAKEEASTTEKPDLEVKGPPPMTETPDLGGKAPAPAA